MPSDNDSDLEELLSLSKSNKKRTDIQSPVHCLIDSDENQSSDIEVSAVPDKLKNSATPGQNSKSSRSKQLTGVDQILDEINKLYSKHKVILKNQQKTLNMIGGLSVKLDEINRKRSYSNGTTGIATFEMKTIDSIQSLEEFERQLSNPESYEFLKEKYLVLCTVGHGTGTTCAYRLLDTLFSKEFLCRCSWTGGSRNSDLIKFGFKQFKNVLRFFFDLVHTWDETYTVQECEAFFKVVLKNAVKRNEAKNMRTSSKRNRRHFRLE